MHLQEQRAQLREYSSRDQSNEIVINALRNKIQQLEMQLSDFRRDQAQTMSRTIRREQTQDLTISILQSNLKIISVSFSTLL